MKAEPRHWAKYYHARGAALDYDLQYSLSDRIRYYWPDPEIARAQDTMFRNLARQPAAARIDQPVSADRACCGQGRG